MHFLRTTAFNAMAAFCTISLVAPSFAQSPYPDRPVKVIVALPAGGSVDMIARTLSQKLNVALGQITYASSGDGSPQHLAGLMFETRTQTRLLHVPYKGGAPAINDTLAGSIDAMFAVMPEAIAHIKAGKLHALGVMSPQRSAVLPDTPTMAEAGFANLSLSAWIGLLAPAKASRAIIEQLNRAVQAALDADVKAKLAESGMEVATSSPEQLQRLIARDVQLHAELVKAAGLTPQ
jgi:tripartite-type tricarboxylate transporter receptor subunit TctC